MSINHNYFKRAPSQKKALKIHQLRTVNLSRLLTLPLMPIARHFCYSVKQCSCSDNKHLVASGSEGDAAGESGYVCLCVFCACSYVSSWTLRVTREHKITQGVRVAVKQDSSEDTKRRMEVCVCVRLCANTNINLARNIKWQSSEKNGEARQQ